MTASGNIYVDLAFCLMKLANEPLKSRTNIGYKHNCELCVNSIFILSAANRVTIEKFEVISGEI